MTRNGSTAAQRVLLQSIVCTEYDTSPHTALYYRARGQHQYDDQSGAISLECHASLAFNTYFNSLNYYKWNKYTHVKKVFLELTLQGKFKIILKSEKTGVEDAQTKVVYFDSFKEENEESRFISLEPENTQEKEYPVRTCTCSFEGLENFPNLYFEIVALSGGAVFYGGEYFTLLEDPNVKPSPVCLGVLICAHEHADRAAPLTRRICESSLSADRSVMQSPPRIYIAHSGNVPLSGISDYGQVRLLGGADGGISGAIARGFLEIFQDKADPPVTHVLTLKANVCLSRHSLAKLIHFLSLLKPCYAKASIAFGVLDPVHRNRQLHSGTFWVGTGCVPVKPLFDLRNFSLVIQNEIMEKSNVALWTAACHPIKALGSGALPLPLFTEASEAEFCLRFAPELITLNGLCVWHSESPADRASCTPYYRMRDACIVAAVRGVPTPLRAMKKQVWKELLGHIFCLRFSSAELLLDAMEDFCRGVSWLREQNPVELHSRILIKTPKALPVEKQAFRFVYRSYERDKKIPTTNTISPLIRLLTLNGHLLPPRGMRVLPMTESAVQRFYRVRRVFLYNEEAQTGYTLRWDFSSVLTLLRRGLAVRALMDRRYQASCKEYRERRNDLRSSEFWKAYLSRQGG